MSKVIAEASMSLDGYIAKHDNSIGGIFDWLQNGDIEVPTPAGDLTFRMGSGRPFFVDLSLEDVPLGDPTVSTQGKQVTHLLFPVTRP